MASFRKRGKSWEYKVSTKEKPITKGGFKTKKEAMIAAAEIEDKVNKGLTTNLKPKAFDSYFENWINLYKQNLAGSTKSHYQDSLSAVRDYFNDKAIQQITRDEYQRFINVYGSSRSKETVDKLNRHVRSCVKDAVEDRIIPFDFTRKVTITYTVKAKRPEEKHLNFEETKELQKELTERLDQGLGYYMLLLAITSGLRYSELIGLTRKDFDFKNNIITINKTWIYKKGNPGFGETKNYETRSIKMNEKTMTIFKGLLDSTPTNLNQLVFYSPSSKFKVLTNTAVNKTLKKTLKELGINSITIHGLRHTHASFLLYKKISINYISERLGHKNIETTWSTYAHILKEMRIEDEENTIRLLDHMAM